VHRLRCCCVPAHRQLHHHQAACPAQQALHLACA
jgi:hypothetical protein